MKKYTLTFDGNHFLHKTLHVSGHIKDTPLNFIDDPEGDKNILLWKNVLIISVKDYDKISYNQHKNLPWEREAVSNEKLVSNFYRSKYMKNLKGKDANIDFMFIVGR